MAENNISALAYQKVESDDIRLLNHFLKQHQQASASRGDQNYTVKRQGAIIGCARLIPIEPLCGKGPCYWLRGVFVKEEERRQGIATQLLEFLHHDFAQGEDYEISPEPNALKCFAFPLAHLSEFYTALGYRTCNPEELPESLSQRYQRANDTGKNWLCMVKTLR